MPDCVVNFSGGACSFLAADRAVKRFGPQRTVLVFADTGEEWPDLYRFLRDATAYLGSELVIVRADFTMDELIDKYGAIPSSRMGFCTRVLKQEVTDKWIAGNAPTAIRVFGMDWTEINRANNLKERLPNSWCPMTEPPYLPKSVMLDR